MLVTIVTPPMTPDYGSLLQALALQTLVSSLGHDCSVTLSFRGAGLTALRWRRLQRRWLRATPGRQPDVLLATGDAMGCMEQLERTTCSRKAAYALHFGSGCPPSAVGALTRSLGEMDLATVTDATGISFMRMLGLPCPGVVLDPVKLLCAEGWRDLLNIGAAVTAAPYVLAYFFNPDGRQEAFAAETAQRMRLPLKYVTGRLTDYLRPGRSGRLPSLPEFASMVAGASKVITDSPEVNALRECLAGKSKDDDVMVSRLWLQAMLRP